MRKRIAIKVLTRLQQPFEQYVEIDMYDSYSSDLMANGDENEAI